MTRFFYLPTLLFLLFALTSCFNACTKDNSTLPIITKTPTDTSPEFGVRYQNHTGWTYNQNVYEVNIRQYTPEGTFSAFEKHLPRLNKMGVGVLWLMPINPIGEQNRKGALGSYYSVKDYSTTNEEFGSKEEFKHLVQEAHKLGMYVIVDWVPNHTSWDNTLTISHPDYYLRTAEGNFQPPIGHSDWTDVIQLDYANAELQTYMIDMLKKWVYQTGIDGFRFDYVDGVPVSFWKKATAELKQLKPDIFLLAEGDGVKYHSMGFDMDYCWALQGWDSGLMRRIYEGVKSVSDLDKFLLAEKSNYMPNKYHMYFTSNHDENSWHGTEFEQLGQSAQVFAVLTQTLSGMPLIYSGQEAAMKKRLAFFDKDQIDWSNLYYEDFYSKLNHLRDTNQALWNGVAGGTPTKISTNQNNRVFAFVREKANSKVIVLLNLGGTAVDFKLSVDNYNGTYFDLFNEKSTTLSNETSINIEPWGYIVLVK